MLKGIDISHHQTEDRAIKEMENADFVIIKATEGKTYTDPLFSIHLQNAVSRCKLIGIYHYARPENNTYIEEVENFIKSFGGMMKKAIPILDWEGNAWTQPIDWCIQWLDYFYYKTGIKPMLYISASRFGTLPEYIKQNYPLWIASYGTNDGQPHENNLRKYVGKDVPLWQYTSNPIDRDIFYGDSIDWGVLCGNEKTESDPHAELKKKLLQLVKEMEGLLNA